MHGVCTSAFYYYFFAEQLSEKDRDNGMVASKKAKVFFSERKQYQQLKKLKHYKKR
ncbi:hypothetical protein ADICYQ_2960 [Cyclobacterium qasimii M12-11B]|uniref:Uncharacterized protein n=1 Tax=Cyclobacterium qasimii M12-11B TaxID=641524 RepID=S7WUX0_9BACT|nr:hypothetical protein ADICYQ_2960 [Cyclobacterium qasimii M12-11B]